MKSTKKIVLLGLILVLTSCSILKPIRVLDEHQAQVILKNKKVLKGKTTIATRKTVKINNQKFQSKEVDKIIIYNDKKANNQYELNFEKTKSILGRRNYWVIKTGEGEHVSSYIGAKGYLINENGILILKGRSQYISHYGGGGHTESPTFPVYMKKKTDDVLHTVGIHGEQFKKNVRNGNIRAGISRYLRDDVKLCSYLRANKLGIDDMPKIVQSYIPNRKGDLVFDGKKIDSKGLVEKLLQVNPLEEEQVIYVEFAKQTSDLRNNQIMIGRTVYKKSFSYGLGIGYTKAKFINTESFVNDNIYSNRSNTSHLPINQKYYKQAPELAIKAYLGFYRTLNVGKYYLIPNAYAYFGVRSVISNDSDDIGLIYGPRLGLDLGKKLNVGNMIFVGLGYEYAMINAFEENHKLDNYKPFAPYNRFSVKLSYKF